LATFLSQTVSIFKYIDLIGPKATELAQNKGNFAVQGHSRSPMSVPMENPYATSYYWLLLTYPISLRFQDIADYMSNFLFRQGLLGFNTLVCGEP